MVVCTFFGIAFLWNWKENWSFPVPWPLLSFPNLLTFWVQYLTKHFLIFIFNWLIVLQCWFDFFHTSIEITMGIHVQPPSLNSCPFPILCYYRAPVWVPWVIQQIPIGYLFTYVGIYASMLLSPFISPSPTSPRPLSISLFSMSASLLLLCKQVHWYHPSIFHIYVLIYNICFSLSDLLHSV